MSQGIHTYLDDGENKIKSRGEKKTVYKRKRRKKNMWEKEAKERKRQKRGEKRLETKETAQAWG